MKTVNYPFMIDGQTMPAPSAVTPSRNYLWAQGSGRMSDGTFSGDITAKKWRVDVTWAPVSEEMAETILSLIESKAWHTVRFRSPKDNDFVTATMYAGDISTPVYSYAVEDATYETLSVSFVEQ